MGQIAPLVDRLVQLRTPLTVCPLSNLKLRVIPTLSAHPLKAMLDAGLCVTVNSDDPAYFGGYLNDNLVQTVEALSLTEQDVRQLAVNSVQASFLDEDRRASLLKNIEQTVVY